jgi:hypothetical protein
VARRFGSIRWYFTIFSFELKPETLSSGGGPGRVSRHWRRHRNRANSCLSAGPRRPRNPAWRDRRTHGPGRALT